MSKIAIIIPVLNEVNSINKLLLHLEESISKNIKYEILVIDGGSTDGTFEILKENKNIKIYQSEKGRAIQMNFGAQRALSEILYFLHCDSFPPKNFDTEILNQIEKGNFSGCFKMKFDSNHIVLKISQWFTKFNHRSCRGGDQSLFVESKLFHRLNGFNEKLVIYEDNEFIDRLYKNSNFVVIQKAIITSARKYIKNGVWTLQFHFVRIHLKNWFGASQNEILNYYQKNIK